MAKEKKKAVKKTAPKKTVKKSAPKKVAKKAPVKKVESKSVKRRKTASKKDVYFEGKKVVEVGELYEFSGIKKYSCTLEDGSKTFIESELVK